MPDLLDDLFDPAVPVDRVDPARMRSFNAAKARGKLLRLVQERELDGERAMILGVLARHLGVARLRELGPLCGDEAIPLLNRAALAYAFLKEDVDPGIRADRLPVLAESLLLGCALFGEIATFGAVLPALARAGGAVVARVEPWRLPAAAPGDLVYGPLLRSPGAPHAAVIAALERDPATEAAVRTGAVDPALVEQFSARNPDLRPADGQAWLGARCPSCGGRELVAVVHVAPEWSVSLTGHLSSARLADAEVNPLLSAGWVGDRTARRHGDGMVEVPLDSVVATARTASVDDEAGRRALWLLRGLRPGATDMETLFHAAIREDLGRARAHAAAVRAGRDLAAAIGLVEDALEAGAYAATAADDAAAVWLELLSAVLASIEAPSSADPTTEWAWTAIRDAVARAGQLAPAVSALLPVERTDRLAMRELVAVAFSEDDAGDEDGQSLLDAITRHADVIRRLGYSMRDLFRDAGAPDAMAEALAEGLGIELDAALTEALAGD